MEIMKTVFSTHRGVAAIVMAILFVAGFSARAANINWTNSASGGWNTAANWNPNGAPGANDTAIITNAGVTVSLNGATTVGAIILGTNGAGTVTLSLAGQTLSLNGPLTVNPSGSFTVDGGVLAGNTNAVLSGTIGWSAGTLGGILTLASGSTLNITAATLHDMPNCTLTNNGTVAWNNGTIRSGGGAGTLIVNNGLWDAQSDQYLTVSGYGGGSVFNNYGTFRKSGGTSEFASATIFQNVVFNQLAGVIDVKNGTNGLELAFEGGGNFTGGYITTNQFGLTVLSIGSFNVNGTVTGTNTWQDTGNLVGNNVINGALTWVGGSWNSAASVTIATNSTLIVIGGGGNNDMANIVVTNNGIVAWASGTIRGGNGTVVYNYGLWDAQSDQYLTVSGYGGSSVFNNNGTFRKSGGASEFTNATIVQNVVFNQLAGVIDVKNGTNGLELAFEGGGNFTGGYITTNVNGLTVLGAGSFNVNGTVTGTNTWQDAGNLVGNNVINGGLTWVGGWWNSAVVTIASNSTVMANGGTGNLDMNAAAVTNYGTVAWSSGTVRGGNGTVVYNYGLWNAQSDQQFNDAYGGGTVFNNLGTFRKSGGTNPAVNTLFANSVLFNQPGGVLDVQTGNVVLQGSGNFTGGYITTNATGTTYLSIGSFNINGAATGSNVVENAGNLVGVNVIKGALNWVAGVWNNATVTILPGSIVTVSGGGGINDLAAAVVTNSGTLAWSSGTIRGGTGTTIYNYGLWDAQSDQTFNAAYGGTAVFNNFGTVRKSAGTASTVFAGNVLFDQTSGLLSALTGNILLQGSGNFNGGSITNRGTGVTYLNAGSFNINGTATGGNVMENAGNLAGTNVINGILNWVAGNWDSAVVTIATNSTVIVAGGGSLNDMANCIVTNNGTVAWASGQIRGGGGAGTFISNYGLWDAQSDQQLNNAFGGAGTVFNNFGTFRKEFTSGTTFFMNGVLFSNTGEMDAQDGNIALQGAYALANGTKMSFGLGGSAGNGSISLSGGAAFVGSLSVNLNGFFWPAVGSSFNLLNYTAESGLLFTNATFPAFITWQTNYNPAAFALSVIARSTNATPTNLTVTPIIGTNLLLQWPGDHTGWRIQTQTNPVTVGLSTNWAILAGSSVTNQIVLPIGTTNGTVFFRMIYP
jgi:hypothetical protein